METKHAVENKVLSKKEVIDAWNAATGSNRSYTEATDSYYTASVYTDSGASAKLEFHPDFLNNKYQLVIEDFSAIEGDDNYLDGIQALAHQVQSLREAGLDFELTSPQGYSDGEAIKHDVEAILAPDRDESAAA